MALRHARPPKEPSVTVNNPFERRVAKKKFEVVGQRSKHEQQNVGQARSKAIQNRKATLLVEYQQSGKANTFVDRRFGEDDANLTPEDKALLRFQKQRQKAMLGKKKSAFSLDDDVELTHKGKSLSILDEQDDYVPDDEDDGEIDEEIVKDAHFGGGLFTRKVAKEDGSDEQAQKSRKEVMEEIIAKSKLYKAQKAKLKSERESLTQRLDDEMTELRALLAPNLRRKRNENGEINLGDDDEEEKKDDYDQTVRELSFDMRASATDRLKTPEEQARIERLRLEALEKERLRRMRGEDEDDKLDIIPDLQATEASLSADAIEDSWLPAAETRRERKLHQLRKQDESDEDDEDDEDEDEDEDSGSYNDQPNNMGESDEDEDEDSDEDEDEAENSSKRVSDIVAAARGELPYIIDVPLDQEDFTQLLQDRTIEEQQTIISRIIASNHASLAPGNKKKLETFFGYLMGHLFVIGKPSHAQHIESFAPLMTVYNKFLFDMSQQMPEAAAKIAQNHISATHSRISAALQDKTSLKNPWPSPRELLFFQTITVIFPVSDKRHSVVTPSVLLLSQCLSQCPVRTTLDVLSGLFVSNLLYTFVAPANRYCPEVISFLVGLLSCFTSAPPSLELLPTVIRSSAAIAALSHNEKSNGKKKQKRKASNGSSSLPIPPLEFKLLYTKATEKEPFLADEVLRGKLLASVLRVIRKFANLYRDVPSFPELFSPALSVLDRLSQAEEESDSVRAEAQETQELLKRLRLAGLQTRRPLSLQEKAPEGIKQFRPRFDEQFSVFRPNDPDRERAERKKLQKKYQRELKGAVRELKKDNYFLEEIREKKRRAEDAWVKKKTNEIMGRLGEEQRGINELKRKKRADPLKL